MKVLVLGGAGMLGHRLVHRLQEEFELHATYRRAPGAWLRASAFDAARVHVGVHVGVHVDDFDGIRRLVETIRPHAIINCIGIIKQDAAAKDPITSISVNALFPHRLSALCYDVGARLIHLSTDCVFSGARGGYVESDVSDATDLYGRSKLLGEVDREHCLTIRTSIIGHEIASQHGLLEWFLAQRGKRIRGFARAIFSGLTTNALSNVISTVLTQHPTLHGLYHVASRPINKFDLLTQVNSLYDANVEIEVDTLFECDRSLNASRFLEATGIEPPSWTTMLEQMHRDAQRTT